MQTTVFEHIVQDQIERSTSVLLSKAKEYATDTDRLANFKTAAELQGITPSQALAGMMAKHTQSVYSMIASGEAYTTAQWDEKITDHINYLLLLRAVLEEEHNTPESGVGGLTQLIDDKAALNEIAALFGSKSGVEGGDLVEAVGQVINRVRKVDAE